MKAIDNNSIATVMPGELENALAHVSAGGRLMIATRVRVTIIEQKHLDRWEAFGKPLLKEEDDGFRMRQGKSSIYLFPGHLKMIN